MTVLHAAYQTLQTYIQNVQYLLLSNAALIARTGHIVTLYVYCLSSDL